MKKPPRTAKNLAVFVSIMKEVVADQAYLEPSASLSPDVAELLAEGKALLEEFASKGEKSKHKEQLQLRKDYKKRISAMIKAVKKTKDPVKCEFCGEMVSRVKMHIKTHHVKVREAMGMTLDKL